MARRLIILFLVAASIAGGLYQLHRLDIRFTRPAATNNAQVQRVVSMAPSVTEVMFAIGAGDKLVGVTRYCDYPPEALKLPKVGGYIDPSFEAIMRLKPDLVILTTGNSDNADRLKQLGFRVLEVNQNTVSGIIQSIRTIGQAVGAGQPATKLANSLRAQVEAARTRTSSLRNPPSVLISIGRSMGAGVGEIYAAGQDGFYDELITLAGGRNAYYQGASKTPSLSAEGITRLNPDVIVDLLPDRKPDEVARFLDEWKTLRHVSAVKHGRVYALTGDYVVIPGPRFIQILNDLTALLQPDTVTERK